MKTWIFVAGMAALLVQTPALAQSTQTDTKTVTAVPLPAGDLRPGGMAGEEPKKTLGDRVANAFDHMFASNAKPTQVAQSDH